MWSLLTDPERFFERRREAPTLRGPGMVVSFVGLANVVGIAALLRVSVREAPEEARGYVATGYLITALSAVVGAFAVWLVYAALVHLASGRLGGDGGFARTLWAVGWGFLPAVLASLLYSVGVAYAAFSLPPPDPAALSAFGRSVRATPLVRLTGGVGVVFTLWQGLIWTAGVKHAHGMTSRRAALAAALPVAVSVLRAALTAA